MKHQDVLVAILKNKSSFTNEQAMTQRELVVALLSSLASNRQLMESEVDILNYISGLIKLF